MNDHVSLNLIDLAVFAIYLVAMIFGLAQPLLPHLDVPHVQQSQVDANFYIWAIGWWPYAITHGLNPLFSHQIMTPGGVSLAWATTTPTVSLLMWPVTAIIGPIAAFNLSLILAPPASAWATFILARRLTGKFWPALFAGFVFGLLYLKEGKEPTAGKFDVPGFALSATGFGAVPCSSPSPSFSQG